MAHSQNILKLKHTTKLKNKKEDGLNPTDKFAGIRPAIL